MLDTCPANSLRLITERGHAGFAAELKPGEWVHVAATFNPDGELRLYRAGQRVAAAAAGPAPRSEWERVGRFLQQLRQAGEGNSYEAAQAQLVVDYLAAIHARQQLRDAGRLPALPPESQMAADKSYVEAANRLVDGLKRVLAGYGKSEDARPQRLAALWQATASP
jgi:hypothetical protein